MCIKRICICLIIYFVLLCGGVGYLIYEMNCTHGVYEINISAVCLSNDSVGNEWMKTYEMDGDIITSGKQITVPLDSRVKKR